MKNRIILAASQLLLTSALVAGGTSGGTPPAMTVEDVIGSESLNAGAGLSKDIIGKDRIEQLLSNLPSRELVRAPGGRTLIPLTPENIRRLNMRVSTGAEASVSTDAGEVFNLRKGLAEKLIDLKKAAEVVEKSMLDISTPAN